MCKSIRGPLARGKGTSTAESVKQSERQNRGLKDKWPRMLRPLIVIVHFHDFSWRAYFVLCQDSLAEECAGRRPQFVERICLACLAFLFKCMNKKILKFREVGVMLLC